MPLPKPEAKVCLVVFRFFSPSNIENEILPPSLQHWPRKVSNSFHYIYPHTPQSFHNFFPVSHTIKFEFDINANFHSSCCRKSVWVPYRHSCERCFEGCTWGIFPVFDEKIKIKHIFSCFWPKFSHHNLPTACLRIYYCVMFHRSLWAFRLLRLHAKQHKYENLLKEFFFPPDVFCYVT